MVERALFDYIGIFDFFPAVISDHISYTLTSGDPQGMQMGSLIGLLDP